MEYIAGEIRDALTSVFIEFVAEDACRARWRSAFAILDRPNACLILPIAIASEGHLTQIAEILSTR